MKISDIKAKNPLVYRLVVLTIYGDIWHYPADDLAPDIDISAIDATKEFMGIPRTRVDDFFSVPIEPRAYRTRARDVAHGIEFIFIGVRRFE